MGADYHFSLLFSGGRDHYGTMGGMEERERENTCGYTMLT